jgi:hypothetical protein
MRKTEPRSAGVGDFETVREVLAAYLHGQDRARDGQSEPERALDRIEAEVERLRKESADKTEAMNTASLWATDAEDDARRLRAALEQALLELTWPKPPNRDDVIEQVRAALAKEEADA